MSAYKANIRLKNADVEDYERLDKEMEAMSFDQSRIPPPEGGREYRYKGNGSLQEVTAAAYRAAHNTGKRYSFTVKTWVIIVLLSIGVGRTLAGSPGDSLLPLPPWRASLAVTSELSEIETGYRLTGNHRQAFARLLSMLGTGPVLWTGRVRFRLFSDLARVSARMRLYPVAMRCYYHSEQGGVDLPEDSIYYKEVPLSESVPVPVDSIRAAFEDGKEAGAYALLVHVQQPAPGKRKVFVRLGSVGHTFITLIKYNRDNTIVCRTFGFYPHKRGFLSASPVRPTAPSAVKDDSRHDWDETAGKFISSRQFKKIVDALQRYRDRLYNLNHENCTDFGLAIARIGGIGIQDTQGRWPLGRGNNPGCAGQSILEGKITDIETGMPLFVATNHLPD
jgi:hypothetical protein